MNSENNEPQIWFGYYKGDEFPDYYGEMIDYMDDNSDPNNPCYKVRFRYVLNGEWIGNMHDEDISSFMP